MTVGTRAVAGWYQDPSGRYRERWWDGTSWTAHVRGELVGPSERAARSPDRSQPDVATLEIPAVAEPRAQRRTAARRSTFWSRWSRPVLACVYGGAAGIAIGSNLSWVEASDGEFSVSTSGIEGDGVITLALAVLVASGFTLLRSRRAAAILALCLGALAGLVVGYDLIDISNKTGDVPTDVDVSAKPGVGLLLTGLAAVAVTVGGALASDEAEHTTTRRGARSSTRS